MNHNPNTDKIRAGAAKKSAAARKQALDAIQRLLDAGKPVNFNSVSREGDVSKTFLYDEKHSDIAQMIRQLAERPVPTKTAQHLQHGKSETTKDLQIARLQERIKILEKQVREKDLEIEKLYGKLATHKAG